MDREIPKEVRNKERNKKIIRYGGIGVASVIVISVLISFMRTGVKTKDLVFSTVDKGTMKSVLVHQEKWCRLLRKSSIHLLIPVLSRYIRKVEIVWI